MSMSASGSRAFQSTPSAWRETCRLVQLPRSVQNFNPLPPHGGRRIHAEPSATVVVISIHSLRMEGDDVDKIDDNVAVGNFNPLPPHGGRPASLDAYQCPCDYFNPLPPHGGRHSYFFIFLPRILISIHSLRMEGDASTAETAKAIQHFNPLPPHGGRHDQSRHIVYRHKFQSTPSAWRETVLIGISFFPNTEFQSTPSAWRETCSF